MISKRTLFILSLTLAAAIGLAYYQRIRPPSSWTENRPYTEMDWAGAPWDIHNAVKHPTMDCEDRSCTQILVDRVENLGEHTDQSMGIGLSNPTIPPTLSETLREVHKNSKRRFVDEANAHPGVAMVIHTLG